MDQSITYAFPLNESEVQNVFAQVLAQGLKSVPRPELPSWIEALGDFIKSHPWIFGWIVIGILVVCLFIIRELTCMYLKTNEILERLKNIEKRI